MYQIGCPACLGQTDIIDKVGQDISAIGKAWVDLNAQCLKISNPDVCRQVLGYKPLLFPTEPENPGNIKWYWFIVFGIILGRISK